MYQRAANSCRTVGWPVLAAIGDVESAHGRYMGPSSAGALGPAQFMPATWSSMVRKGWAVDGDKDGRYDIYDPEDAFPTAAVYLCKSGATSSEGIRKALWHYNHSTSYVNMVSALSWSYARAYPTGGAPARVATPFPGRHGKILTPFRRETAGEEIVATAKQYLGVPYRWGGTDPRVGLDCSSLVQLVYRRHGISLPRVSHDQARMGVEVPGLAQAQPGDLVYFAGRINHIGIYVGDGRMLHAPRTGDVVKISAVWKTPTTIRRVLTSDSPGTPVMSAPSVKILQPFGGGVEALERASLDTAALSELAVEPNADVQSVRLAASATIVVETGDSLWALSERSAAEGGAAWAELYELNADVIGADPGLVTPGMQLELPAGW